MQRQTFAEYLRDRAVDGWLPTGLERFWYRIEWFVLHRLLWRGG